MSSNKTMKNIERNNIALFCLRNDIEKILSADDVEKLKQEVISYNLNVMSTDLQLDYNVNKEERKNKIKEKMILFSSSRIVFTDRLHGLIFSAITGTPCIAFDNYNYKISGTYLWLHHLPYIKYVKNINDAKLAIEQLLSVKTDYSYDNKALQKYYNVIVKEIEKYVN